MRFTFKDNAGQNICRKGAGIDPDAMVLNVGLLCGLVSVDDNLAVILPRVEKLAANPHEIIGFLHFEGHSGFDARMNEDVISRLMHKLQVRQETQMIWWNASSKFLPNVFKALRGR